MTVVEIHPSTHPPLPPTTEDERLAWLRLLRSYRVGISTFYRLLHEHGSAADALDALPHVAASAGVDDYAPCPEGVARAEVKAGRKAGARLVFVGTPDYPQQLLDIADPPPMLWVQSDDQAMTRPMIGIVGSRNASSLGLRMARALAADLAEAGFVIVSGLARGIDGAAHEAALTTGTVAVMGGGVDVLYPSENAKLAVEMLTHGARVSEMPMGTQPQARHFPRRNRIISGLAQALIVVEAAAKSGSLLTARSALDQGRDVMAVPGHPFDGRATGCNLLIRDGATLVRSAADVIDALPKADPQAEMDLPSAPPETRSLQETAELHSQILNKLSTAPVAEDQLIRDLASKAQIVSPEITRLELEGRVRRQAGGMLSLA
ncbi:DNA-processing protein DprA [Pseudooceanicola sp. MF1-13]|uniref:DNA-processing protein DprA n=1 Tax=Pseudooceanicola sp. MF1-13 TaxID=3379095 RepID=UPI003891E753